MKALIAATALAVFHGAGAFAQGASCATHDTVVKRLADGYGETRQSIGLAPNNSVVEVFASLETGTWTITVTNTSGITCLVASGQSYEPTGHEVKPQETAL